MLVISGFALAHNDGNDWIDLNIATLCRRGVHVHGHGTIDDVLTSESLPRTASPVVRPIGSVVVHSNGGCRLDAPINAPIIYPVIIPL